MIYDAFKEVTSMKNNLIKLLTLDKEIRLYITDTTDILINSNLKDMKTDVSKQLYKQIFTGCSLLYGFLTEKDQRLNISIRFKPEGYSAQCDIDGSGNIHCIFSSKLKVFDGELADLVGEGASLSITRGSWMGGMFTGTIELKSDSVESWLTDFYSKSEQIETIFRTWTSNGIVRGCMIQPLPFYCNDNLNNVIESVDNNEIYLWTGKWSSLHGKVFPYASIIEEYRLQTECNCSKEMFFGLLMSVDADELKVSIQRNKSEELECGICGKKYVFNRSELEAIVEIKERK